MPSRPLVSETVSILYSDHRNVSAKESTPLVQSNSIPTFPLLARAKNENWLLALPPDRAFPYLIQLYDYVRWPVTDSMQKVLSLIRDLYGEVTLFRLAGKFMCRI
jgi:hypothetical protein